MTTYRHVAKGVFPGEEWSCTFHTTSEDTLAAGQATWVTAWTNLWQGVAPPVDNLDQLISDLVSTTSLSTASLDPATGKQVSRMEDDVTLAGTGATGSLPPQLSVCASYRTVNATRGGRGRMYMPVFDVGALTAGLLSNAAQNIVLQGQLNMVNALRFGGFIPVLINRKTMVTTEITSIDVDDVFDTQRRRRNKLQGERISVSL
jgi:hypothetical protein